MTGKEKKFFSREDCRSELIKNTKAECVFYGLPVLAVALITVPIVGGMFSAFENSPMILRLLALLILLSPTLVLFGPLLWRLWEYAVFSRDRFLIVEDRVIQKKIRQGRNGTLRHTLYFASCGKYVVSEALFADTSCGEAFWVVIVSPHFKVSKMIYPAKRYEPASKQGE